MKYCTKCGKEIMDEAVVCIHCGCSVREKTKYCSRCGKAIMDEAVICVHCGCPVQEKGVEYQDDEVSIGLCILAALIPLFGFIYCPIKYKETPKKAKACGITAIVSFLVCFVISILSNIAFYM